MLHLLTFGEMSYLPCWNFTVFELYAWDNFTVFELYAWDNFTVFELYAWDNFTVFELYAWDNSAINKHQHHVWQFPDLNCDGHAQKDTDVFLILVLSSQFK